MLSPPASTTATSVTAEASGTQGPPDVSRKTKPPPVPTTRGKYPGSTSPNVMVQQILQAAVAGLPSVPPLQPAGEEDKDEESQYESIDLHSPVQSIPSSEEGEGVYVLFNEEESVLEEVDECECICVWYVCMYVYSMCVCVQCVFVCTVCMSMHLFQYTYSSMVYLRMYIHTYIHTYVGVQRPDIPAL